MIRVTHWYTNFKAEAKTYKQALKKLDKMISEFCADGEPMYDDEMQKVLVEYTKTSFSNRIIPLSVLDVIPKSILAAPLNRYSLTEAIMCLRKARGNMVEQDMPPIFLYNKFGRCSVIPDELYERYLDERQENESFEDWGKRTKEENKSDDLADAKDNG